MSAGEDRLQALLLTGSAPQTGTYEKGCCSNDGHRLRERMETFYLSQYCDKLRTFVTWD